MKKLLSIILIFSFWTGVSAFEFEEFEQYVGSEEEAFLDYDFDEHIRKFSGNCNFEQVSLSYGGISEKRAEIKELYKKTDDSIKELGYADTSYSNKAKELERELEDIIEPLSDMCGKKKLQFIKNYVQDNKIIIGKLERIVLKEYKKNPKSIKGILGFIEEKEDDFKAKDYERFLLIQQLKRMCKQAINSDGEKIEDIFESFEDWDVKEYQ